MSDLSENSDLGQRAEALAGEFAELCDRVTRAQHGPDRFHDRLDPTQGDQRAELIVQLLRRIGAPPPAAGEAAVGRLERELDRLRRLGHSAVSQPTVRLADLRPPKVSLYSYKAFVSGIDPEGRRGDRIEGWRVIARSLLAWLSVDELTATQRGQQLLALVRGACDELPAVEHAPAVVLLHEEVRPGADVERLEQAFLRRLARDAGQYLYVSSVIAETKALLSYQRALAEQMEELEEAERQRRAERARQRLRELMGLLQELPEAEQRELASLIKGN